MPREQPGPTVRLLIFSGRPDPEWSLDEGAVRQLGERLARTIGGERAPSPQPFVGLGYRGFLVQNPSNVPGLPATFSVFRRVLAEPHGPRANHWRDAGDVEGWLLAQARERGFGKALEAFGAGAEPPGQR